MTMSPAKQFYYCFSCGAGGNAVKFLMELQHASS
jgi:DNA primase